MQNRTYRYFTGEALYPFGFGLSYTHFSLSDPSVAADTARVTVVNDGPMAGDAVVQVYVAADHPQATPHARLCGFARVSLNKGERRDLTISLDP